MGSTKAPSGVHQRPVGVQTYKSTDVQGVEENVAIEEGDNWFSVKRDPAVYNSEKCEKPLGRCGGRTMEDSRSC